MVDSKCGFCGKSLEVPGLGRQSLPCTHVVHESCAHKARLRGDDARCPNCGYECAELMGANALYLQGKQCCDAGYFENGARFLSDALDLEEHVESASLLGALLVKGIDVPQNLKKGVELLEIGVRAKHEGALLELGRLHLTGEGVSKNPSKALRMIQQAHESGNWLATVELGNLYARGEVVKKDVKQTLKYYTQALMSNIPIDPDVACLLGVTLLEGKELKHDVPLALKLLELSHKGGSPAASLALAIHYHTKQMFRRSAQFYEAAYWGGHARRMPRGDVAYTLGCFYLSGMGVEKDESKGMQLLLIARDLGHPAAVEFVPQLILGKSNKELEELTDGAKLYFAPSDVEGLSAADLQQRATKRWECAKAGRNPFSSGIPSQLVAASNAHASTSIPRTETETCRVHVIEFSRHPQVLRQALLEGQLLSKCRDALTSQGLAPELSSGAKVFVQPEHFTPVTEAVASMNLKPWHVVTSDEFEPLVMTTVQGLPGRAQVREKGRTSFVSQDVPCCACGAEKPRFRCQRCRSVFYCSQACQQRDWRLHRGSCLGSSGDCGAEVPVVVNRTFLDVPMKSSLRSSAVSGDCTKSTTDMDTRKGHNPRKA